MLDPVQLIDPRAELQRTAGGFLGTCDFADKTLEEVYNVTVTGGSGGDNQGVVARHN